jgi:NADH-quinone oxidoreductase subunit J
MFFLQLPILFFSKIHGGYYLIKMNEFSLSQILFYFFGSISVVAALGVILNRNPITAAVLLVLTFFSLSAIYAIMGATFIATMQILVYAGAIMVLVVFVLMLLSLKTETISKVWEFPLRKVFLFFTVGILLLFLAMGVSIGVPHGKVLPKGVDTTTGKYEYKLLNEQGQATEFSAKGNVAVVGASTFIDYLLPFEMISILLLVAVIGAVILAKKKLEQQ